MEMEGTLPFPTIHRACHRIPVHPRILHFLSRRLHSPPPPPLSPQSVQLTVVDSLLAVKHLLEFPFPRDLGSLQLSCTAATQAPSPRPDAEARTLFPFGVAEFVRRAIAYGTQAENTDTAMISRAHARAGTISEALSQACATHDTLYHDLPLTHHTGCDRIARSSADPGARETTIQLFLSTPTALSHKRVVVNTSDTPELVKRQVADIDLSSFGLPAKRQALRCICSRELQDSLTLGQQHLRDGDTVCLEPLDRCGCTLYHLTAIEHRSTPATIPSLKSLARRAVLRKAWPHKDLVRHHKISPALKRYILSPEPSPNITRRPWFKLPPSAS